MRRHQARIVAVAIGSVALAEGGFTERTEARQRPTPTFGADVAPILYEHCVACHREGEMAPMPLTTFHEVRPWARAIRTAVIATDMPPWGATSNAGAIANDPSLSVREIDTMVRWVAAGAPEGDPRVLPLLPAADSRWKMGTPDLVLSMAEPFEIAAESRSVYGDFPLRTSFAEDKYIRAAEVQPLQSRRLTHHARFGPEIMNGYFEYVIDGQNLGERSFP